MSNKVTFDVLARSKATGFDETNRKILQQAALANKASKDSEKQVKLLGAALTAAGAAAIPFGAAAVAAGVGAAGAAGAAALAVTGLVKDWKAGTLQGTAFASQVKILERNVGVLQQTAAAGAMPGFTQGLKDINKLVPQVKGDVRGLSVQVGQLAGNTAAAAVGGFHQLAPVMETFDAQLVTGSKHLKDWATSSNGLRVFGAYAENQLPLVNQTLANVAVTGGHAVEALAPFGTTVVRGINTFSAATRAIPLSLLQTALPLLSGALIGKTIGNKLGQSNAAGGISNAIGNISGRLAAAGKEGGAASKILAGTGKVISNLGVVGLIAGGALGGLSAVMGIGERNAARYRAQVDKVTQALQNGTAAQAAWVAAQNTGADAAKTLGLSQKQIVDQIQAGQKATSAYTAKINALKDQELALQKQLYQQQKQDPTGQQTQKTAKQLNDVVGQLDILTGKVSKSGKEYSAAKDELAKWATAQGDAGLAAQIASGQFVSVAKSLGIQAGDYVQAKAAADAHAASTREATAEMILENNAAGLLNQTLQGFHNNNLGVAQAVSAVAAASNAAAKALKDNKNSITGNSAAAVADQQALQAAAAAAIQHGQAVAQQTGSTVKATAAIKDDKAALEAQLASQHRLTPAVQAYIDTLFKIPPLKKTKIDADTAAAYSKVSSLIGLTRVAAATRRVIVGADTSTAYEKLQALNSYLQSFLHPVITPTVRGSLGAGRNAQAATGGYITDGRVRRLAAGGPAGMVFGPGTGTSDTAGLFALSNGEYVSNARATSRNKAALIAGNHGATLGIISGAAPTGHAGPLRVAGGRVELGVDAQGTLTAHIIDLILDQAEFAAQTSRMG